MSDGPAGGAGSGLGPAPLPSAPSASPQQPGRGQLWLVRHGETAWSRDGRHTGRTDVPLTGLGEEQARALAALLGPLRPVLVLVSPRQRALRTAELAGLVPGPGSAARLVVEPDLAEWDYGEYEGRTSAEIRTERPGWTIWTGGAPGGETAAEVGKRADRALGTVHTALASGDVVVVGHGHLCRVLTARWLGLDATCGRLFALGPAAPCALGAEHAMPVVQRWNLPNPAVAAGQGAAERRSDQH